jgi:hypothetical protein
LISEALEQLKRVRADEERERVECKKDGEKGRERKLLREILGPARCCTRLGVR